MKNKDKNEILVLMEQCGHFLHHRRGGKRGQGRILKILYKEGEMTQRELQDCLGIQSGSMSEIVLKLEGNGLICRERDEEDKRKINLRITEEGRRFFQEKHEAHIEQDKKLFDMLTKEEQEQLKALLTKVLEGWEANFDSTLFEHKRGCKKQNEHERKAR